MNVQLRQEIWDWVRTLAIALVAALFLKAFVFYMPLVPTESMVPTIGLEERILVEKVTYRFSQPKRGELVVFPNPDNPAELFVKRLIGMGGETVEIRDGIVLIDGQPLDEPYLTVTTQGRWGPYNVPAGQLFFLGDNRNMSHDSRFWKSTHYISAKEVKGRARAVVFPFTRVRGLR